MTTILSPRDIIINTEKSKIEKLFKTQRFWINILKGIFIGIADERQKTLINDIFYLKIKRKNPQKLSQSEINQIEKLVKEYNKDVNLDIQSDVKFNLWSNLTYWTPNEIILNYLSKQSKLKEYSQPFDYYYKSINKEWVKDITKEVNVFEMFSDNELKDFCKSIIYFIQNISEQISNTHPDYITDDLLNKNIIQLDRFNSMINEAEQYGFIDLDKFTT